MRKAEVATVPMVAAASPLILGPILGTFSKTSLQNEGKTHGHMASSEIVPTLSSVAEPGCSSEHLDLPGCGFGSFLLPGFQRDIYPKTPRTIKAKALTK